MPIDWKPVQRDFERPHLDGGRRVCKYACMSEQNSTVERVTVSLPKELAARIVDYWHDHRLKSQSETVRVLVEAGLEAAGKRRGKS